jgi:hypothetical protein
MALTPEELRRLQELETRKRMTHSPSAAPLSEPESAEFKAGRTMPRPAQVALKTAQALSGGLLPYLTGPKTGEITRGASTQFTEDYPKTSFGLDVAGSMAPSLIGVTAGPTIANVGARMVGAPRVPPPQAIDVGPMTRVGTAAMTGGVEGGVSGFGYSNAKTDEERMRDILFGTFMGAAGGGVSSAGTNVLGAVGTNIGERASQKIALSEAQKRLIQALIRDTPEGQDVGPYVANRLRNLGPESALLDVGENSRQLADLLATLPGRSKQELRDFVEQRAFSRGERMAAAGQEGLDTGGKRVVSTLDDLAEQRSREAGPLYLQLEGMSVSDPSGVIGSIVKRAEELGATRIARSLAKTQQVTRGGKGWTYKGTESGTYNASDLANIKEGLDALVEKETDKATGKISKLGLSYAELRNKLRAELIDSTTDPKTGQSVYKQALDAWAGPSAASEAADLGKTVLSPSLSADQLRKNLSKMSDSELEAFRIGAFEAIRSKVGTSKGGRTEMMNLVENFVPREKLQVVFGSPEKFDQFYRTMLAERTMREADVLGRNSQTVSRQTALGEMNADLALDVGGMASGGPMQFITGAARMWNQAQLPEKTRDQLARALMTGGPRAERDVFSMENVARELAKRRVRRASAIGGAGGGTTTGATRQKEE